MVTFAEFATQSGRSRDFHRVGCDVFGGIFNSRTTLSEIICTPAARLGVIVRLYTL